MDIYVDYLLDLAAYIKKNAQLANTHIFKGNNTGLMCLITLDNIEPTGPQMGPQVQGRDLTINLALSAPIDNWKELLQKVGKMESVLQDCESRNNELKVKYHLTLGAWSRTEDESNLIYENSLSLKCVRLDTT